MPGVKYTARCPEWRALDYAADRTCVTLGTMHSQASMLTALELDDDIIPKKVMKYWEQRNYDR